GGGALLLHLMHVMAGNAAADGAEYRVVMRIVAGDRSGGAAGNAPDRLRRRRREGGNRRKGQRHDAGRENLAYVHLQPPNRRQAPWEPMRAETARAAFRKRRRP